jgi:hypothetical protein
MLAADLIRAVEQAGGHLSPDGDSLVVEAPEPLPEPIMTELRAHKAEVLVALRKREIDRLRAAEHRAQKRTRDQLPKRIAETRKHGDELVKAAKGLDD